MVIAGGDVSDVALHYLEKFKIMTIKILSKFELRRIANATGATMLVRYVRLRIYIYQLCVQNIHIYVYVCVCIYI